MFLGWPFSKIVCQILIGPKTWLWWMGASCTIGTWRNSLKNLLQNCWSDFEIISQECSFGDPFKKVFAKFRSVHKHGSGEWGFSYYKDMKKFLKNLLLRNCRSDFEIISQEFSLSDRFQNLFAKFWSDYKYGSGEWGLFELYGHEDILKKLFSPKPLVRFWNNFTGMFLGWPFLKKCLKILICL